LTIEYGRSALAKRRSVIASEAKQSSARSAQIKTLPMPQAQTGLRRRTRFGAMRRSGYSSQ
jgi:hypothetical protein